MYVIIFEMGGRRRCPGASQLEWLDVVETVGVSRK